MRTSYTLDWLINEYDSGKHLKFLFFWGHTKKSNETIGSFSFSQWFELPFVVDGVTYKTAEHWMMANKALLAGDFKTYEKIIASTSAAEAKKLGRMVLGFDEIAWRDNSMDIVINGNIHKFNQHPDHANYLLNTKDRILVEASPADKIWGIGLAKDAENIDNPHFWDGENLLGFALMETRAFLQQFGQFEYFESEVEIPFKKYPKIARWDMFWRMGDGESDLTRFFSYYAGLNDRQQTIFKLSYPPPFTWPDFYG